MKKEHDEEKADPKKQKVQIKVSIYGAREGRWMCYPCVWAVFVCACGWGGGRDERNL